MLNTGTNSRPTHVEFPYKSRARDLSISQRWIIGLFHALILGGHSHDYNRANHFRSSICHLQFSVHPQFLGCFARSLKSPGWITRGSHIFTRSGGFPVVGDFE